MHRKAFASVNSKGKSQWEAKKQDLGEQKLASRPKLATKHVIPELPLSETPPCRKLTFRSAFKFWLALIPS